MFPARFTRLLGALRYRPERIKNRNDSRTQIADLTVDFLQDCRLTGLVIGIGTFLIIGLFHPVVIKAEYYWGTRCWWVFVVLGVAGLIGSVLTDRVLLSSLAGVFAFSSFWSVKEIFEQRERVLKGWFPMNPKRAADYETSRTCKTNGER